MKPERSLFLFDFGWGKLSAHIYLKVLEGQKSERSDIFVSMMDNKSERSLFLPRYEVRKVERSDLFHG